MTSIRKNPTAWAILATALAFAFPVQAQLHFNPIGKAPFLRSQGEIGFGVMEADHEVKTNVGVVEETFEREFIYSSLAFDINEVADACIGIAYNAKSAYLTEEVSGEDGFNVSAGIRAQVFKKKASSIHTYGQVNYFDEDYGNIVSNEEFQGVPTRVDLALSGSGIETILGAVYAHQIGSLTLFGGVEFAPFSRKNLEHHKTVYFLADKLNEERLELEFERSDPLSGKLGAQLDFELGSIHLDATIVGEETFRISVSLPF